MRSRITRALYAAVAAGVALTTFGFAAATSANASVARQDQSTAQPPLGPTIATKSAAGYENSGRFFRYAQAVITVPDISHFNQFFPEEYIQLSNGSLNNVAQPTGDQFTRAGIMPCTVFMNLHPSAHCTTAWVAFIDAFNNSIFHPFFFRFVPLNVQPGDGVFFSIFFDQAGNELHFVINPPPTTSGALFFKTRAFGPIFDHAAALDDFVNVGGRPITLPPFAQPFRINQFLQGAMTTYSGARGSFVGPWTTSPVVATSNGLPFPQGHVVVSPGPLFSDGLVANGAVRRFDAFSVFARR